MTHLSLGRVSNLPTVWTNVLAAGAMAGAAMPSDGWLSVLIAMSLFYIAGMYYNDVCDAQYDKQHQPHRPIAAALITRERVEAYAIAYALLGFLLVYNARMAAPMASESASVGWLLSVCALVALIIAYNRHHKNNPLSPLIMAACRAAVLVTTGYTLTGTLPPMLLLMVLATLCWVIGLTYFAKHEQSDRVSTHLLNRWPLALMSVPVFIGVTLSLFNIAVLFPLAVLVPVIVIAYKRITEGTAAQKGQSIGLMIAAISLVDSLFLASVWGMTGALAGIGLFALTLVLQRWVSGT